jgi:predicted ArsR family transcriptional regulator
MENQPATIDLQTHMQALKAVHSSYAAQKIEELNQLKEKLPPETLEVILKTSRDIVCKPYANHFSGIGSIDELIGILWEPLRKAGYVFETKPVENGVQVHCTRCPYANLYRELGGEEWGFQLYCAADAELVEQFNPSIKFERTKILMQGQDCCNHRYTMK